MDFAPKGGKMSLTAGSAGGAPVESDTTAITLRGWSKGRGSCATGMPSALPAVNKMNPLPGIYAT